MKPVSLKCFIRYHTLALQNHFTKYQKSHHNTRRLITAETIKIAHEGKIMLKSRSYISTRPEKMGSGRKLQTLLEKIIRVSEFEEPNFLKNDL